MIKMNRLIGVAIACLLVGALIGFARHSSQDPEAEKLLEKAIQANQNLDYTANATTYARYGDEILHSEAVYYNAKGGKNRIEYRLGSLSGVIAGRTGDRVNWRFDPLHRHMVMGARPNQGNPHSTPDLEMLLRNSNAKVVRHTKIAGRPAAEVLLEPKSGAGSRSLWIDVETGVILRSEERNENNQLITATQFSSIDYGKTAGMGQFIPIPPDQAPVKWVAENDFASEVTNPKQIEKLLGVKYAEPGYIPAGFVREGAYIYRCPGCNTKTAVTRYVDGLSSLSIVQAPEECEQHMEKRPLDFGLGKAVFAKHGPSYFWVMGEMPKAELDKVSQSLK